MRDFVAIDFETANQHFTSICSVGAVRVEGGAIAGRVYHLVRPTPNFYTRWCTAVHGLRAEDTADAPSFPDVWAELHPFLRGLPLVAHNAPFDSSRLYATLEHYHLPRYSAPFSCTLAAARRHFGRMLADHRLPTVAAACGFELRGHHHALSDAEACACIAIAIL